MVHRKPSQLASSVESVELRRLLSGSGTGNEHSAAFDERTQPLTAALLIRHTRYGEFNVAPRPPKIGLTEDGTFIVTGSKNADDIVVDSSMLDSMRALHGDIRIKRIHVDAGAGNDTVEMKVGLPATLIGGKGDDKIFGGGRADHISGGDGADLIDGGSGNDTIEGLAAHDHLTGGPGADLLIGGDDRDELYGGSGDDTMRGGAGGDYFVGHDGDDLIYGDAGRDNMFGGPGRDRFKCLDGEVDIARAGPPGEGDRFIASDEDDQLQPGGW